MGSPICVTAIREIPLNKLVPSVVNVRQTASDNAIEELAASILAHGLLQNMTVRPQLDEDNRETGRFEVIAGGRRLAALKLLVGRKKLAKTSSIPCIVREDGSARELSLVENVLRLQLHPADQFEAFRNLNEEEGLGAEEIGARFGVTARVVRERLKLAAVSPQLIDRYRTGQLTLDQIMAFAVIDDHQRQEEVCDSLSYDTSPSFIRRRLLQGHVPAQDRLAVFVGLESYEAAGGAVLRDLFAADNGGYLTDAGLLERLARAKLEPAAETVRQEGWKWVDVALDHPHAHGLRRVYPRDVDLPEADQRRLEAIEGELDRLEAEFEEADDPGVELEGRIATLRDEYDAIESRARVFEPEDIVRAGAIVSVGSDGALAVLRGLVRPEDELPNEHPSSGSVSGEACEPENPEPETASGLPDRLVADLTAHRSMAMRDQLAVFPEMAHAAITHALALQLFHHGARRESCLTVVANTTWLETHAPGIGDSLAARNISARHESWAVRMPRDTDRLWGFVLALNFNERQALLAHCVALLVDAVARNAGECKPAADGLASAIGLNMLAYWRPSADNYFSRVPKSLILEAVQEGISPAASERLRSLKKPEMAQAAQELLETAEWLPAPLRAAGDAQTSAAVA